MDCLFVDAAHAIINKVGRKQHGHEEDLCIRLLPLLERSESLSIHHHILNGGIVRILQQLRPNPQPLRAGIDRRSDLKPGILVEQHPI